MVVATTWQHADLIPLLFFRGDRCVLVHCPFEEVLALYFQKLFIFVLGLHTVDQVVRNTTRSFRTSSVCMISSRFHQTLRVTPFYEIILFIFQNPFFSLVWIHKNYTLFIRGISIRNWSSVVLFRPKNPFIVWRQFVDVTLMMQIPINSSSSFDNICVGACHGVSFKER